MDRMATDTKERLLAATGELIRRQGYTGTGVKQILADARAPFGSLYHHFPGGKEELGAEAVRRSGRLYALVVADAMAGHEDLAEAVLAGFRGAGETMRESDWADACPIATVALEASSSSEPLREACAEVFEAWIVGLAATFAAAGVADARALAIEFLCALEGAFVFCRALRTTEALDVAGARVAESVRSALG
ncbi:MAG: TetR/AcrR family transcriptional regulator [Solirubrobacterales bacterium]|nr:TetR/AcrR family transcriptional regulator [Solirubrobacterales bacterium]